MKTKNIFLIGLIMIAATIVACSSSHVNDSNSNDTVSVTNMVNSQDFVFMPRSVNPVSGRRRDLTPGYEVSVSKDTIISYMPFFGRGYTAPLSPTDVDFDFTSTKFTYTINPAKHGWVISIKPQDQRTLQELYLRVFDNGSASLNINSMDRSTISYEGYITERKPRKNK